MLSEMSQSPDRQSCRFLLCGVLKPSLRSRSERGEAEARRKGRGTSFSSYGVEKSQGLLAQKCNRRRFPP